MLKNFLSDSPSVRISIDVTNPPSPEREAVKIMAIGSPRGVSRLIHTLHNKGFAEAGAWSRLIPTENPGEVMSILTWYVWLD